MKKIIYYFILTLAMISCSDDDKHTKGEFEFINEYKTTITVGGFVGISKVTFKKGDIYKGTDNGKETIKIRIAEHSELNNNCPNSWCYQEFLEVPREYLKFVQ